MADWYLSENGEKKGPYELAQLQEMRAKGEVTPLHQVWSEAEGRWCLALEVGAELGFELGELYAFSEEPADWVVLKTNGKNKPTLDQAGPFSTVQIRKLLLKGELDFEDYVWRSGYQRWAQIRTLPDFDHRATQNRAPREPGLSSVEEVVALGAPTEPAPLLESRPAEGPEAAQPLEAAPSIQPKMEPEKVRFSNELRLAVAVLLSLFAMVLLIKARGHGPSGFQLQRLTESLKSLPGLNFGTR
jgi:hypothetical protein